MTGRSGSCGAGADRISGRADGLNSLRRVFLVLAFGLLPVPSFAIAQVGTPLPKSRPLIPGADTVNELMQQSGEELDAAGQTGISPAENMPEPRPATGSEAEPEPAPPVKQAKPAFDLAEAKQCERELRKLNARFSVAEPIGDNGQCGWPRPLKLTALSRGVEIIGDIRVRCELALALVRWSKEVLVPSAELHLEKKPSAVRIDTSYQCRRRNNASTGKLSEHAFANGIDVMGIDMIDGQDVYFADRRGTSDAERAFQAAIRGGACAYFTTVIGPMTNAAHADHFHFDLALRRGGYRLCQ